MTYEHEHWGDRVQRQIDAGNVTWRDGFDPVSAGVPSTPRVERLRATITDIERTRGKAPASAPKPTPHEPGPKTRKAMQLAEALRQARRGNVGQALGAEVHKLPVHIVRG